MKKKPDGSERVEIASFNEELVSFDEEDLAVEELERRFELALGVVLPAGGICGEFTCEDVSCSNLACGVFTAK